MCACCLLGVRCDCVCPFFADGALHEVSSRRRLPARPVTTSHRVHTGLEVGEVVDKLEQTLHRACRHSCVSVLVRAHFVVLTHMSDGVRLRVETYTAQCVRVVCSVSVVAVCVLFLRTGRCTRSHRAGNCQHAIPKGETSDRSPLHTPDTHSPNLACSRTRIPSHLLSPGLLGNQSRVSKVCQSLPRRLLRQRTDQCPKWWW